MDKGVVDAEENQRQTESGPSASKSLGSLVQISSIAIDISGAVEEIEPPAHEHFSIRGYAAGIRKKDARTCSPLTLEGDDKDGNLPPLLVPTFRWWRCSDCPKESLVVDDGTNPVCESGLVEHRDGKDNDRIRGHKAPRTSITSILGMKSRRAGNWCPNVQESNQLRIGERPDNADASDVACIVPPPCTVGAIDNVSSGSDDASGALPGRRKPKLRFLADIMVEEKKPNSDNPNTRSVSPSGVQVTSTETEPLASAQLEFDDIDKTSRSPQMKRKNAIEEDGRLARTIAKRSKGFVLGADTTCRRLDSSDQESEENASTKADFPIAAKSQLTKPRKNKALDISKKSRQAQTEDGTVLPRDLRKTIASCTNNLEENIVASQTNMTMIRDGSKLVEEMRQFSTYSLSGNQTDKIYTLPNSEGSTGEADCEDLMLSSKIISEDCNAKGKVALDLSLNSFIDVESNSNDQSPTRTRTILPDLNEAFTFLSAVTQGKQSSLHKAQDGSVSGCHEEPTDPERHVGVSSPQNDENGKKIGSASDDIPMEIVELLAKNQHERELGNSRKHLMPEGIIGSTTTRGYPPIPQYWDGNQNTMNFPFAANRRSVLNGPNGILGIPVNFSQLSNCSRETTKREESQFKIFDSFTPSEQRKPQFSGSSNPIITGPRISTRAELYWPPRGENEPFAVGLNQNRSFVQTNNTGMHIFSDKYGGGMTSNDAKEIDRRKFLHDGILNKKGSIGSSSKSSKGSLDPYSNDTIPALQLLSLMNQGISSGSSFKVGPENFIEKPLSPCNQHPRVNGNENQNFIATSQFSLKFPKLPDGIFFSGESSKKGSSPSQGQVPSHHLESSGSLVMETAKSIRPLGVCTLNKNPAEFSLPNARNKYTLTARDLKPRNRNLPKEKPQTVTEDGRKRQRATKDISPGKSKAAPETK